VVLRVVLISFFQLKDKKVYADQKTIKFAVKYLKTKGDKKIEASVEPYSKSSFLLGASSGFYSPLSLFYLPINYEELLKYICRRTLQR
jgi:hypothetical protein